MQNVQSHFRYFPGETVCIIELMPEVQMYPRTPYRENEIYSAVPQALF
jgi:hypothetical protein